MKLLIAGSLIAITMAVATPASALNIHVGPRGVGVGVGHPYYRGYHRGFGVRRPFVRRPFVRRRVDRF